MDWRVWLFLIVFLLFILYLRGTFHKKVKYKMEDVPCPNAPYFENAIASVSNSLLSRGTASGSWFDIEAIYTARLAAIRQACHAIHMETFFMTPGRRADEFAAALADRAQAGVEVLCIIDSLGALTMPRTYWRQLQAAGVAVRFFHKFDWLAPLSYNTRTHRKMLLIDGELAFVGGMGVSDHWDGLEKTGDTAPWLDFEICCQGEIVGTLEGIFMQHWLYNGGVASLHSRLFPSHAIGSTILVTPSNSTTATSSSISALLYTSFLAAKQRIWFASPYFLPDSNSRQALLQAKKNGVDVRILTVGPHNDKRLVYYAVREAYASLLDAGIEIYEYQPSMMHAKVLLIDDTFVSTGSANLDPRSLFHNEELNLSLAEPQLAEFVEYFFIYGFNHSRRISLKKWHYRPSWQKILGQITLFFRWQL